MNHYYTKLSFEKLEQFDMQRSNLSTFVLIRNTLIHALTQQQQEHFQYYYEEEVAAEEQEQEDELMEQQVWLDSCFSELEENQTMLQVEEEEEEEDSDEDDMIPLSPQDHAIPFSRKKPTFYINEEDEEEEDGLLCYDIPYLSLNNSTHSL